jgi:hypothetical protein
MGDIRKNGEGNNRNVWREVSKMLCCLIPNKCYFVSHFSHPDMMYSAIILVVDLNSLIFTRSDIMADKSFSSLDVCIWVTLLLQRIPLKWGKTALGYEIPSYTISTNFNIVPILFPPSGHWMKCNMFLVHESDADNCRQHCIAKSKYSRASLIRTNWDLGIFGLVNFRINRVLQKKMAGGGGGTEIPRALEWRSQPGAGNNVNKRAVNSFLSAASSVSVYSCVMYCRTFPVF